MDKKNTEIVEQKLFQIPIDGLFDTFLQFLNIKNNDRIFFSGKFGIGKTFFLDNFFSAKSEKYDVYHLFPVNYQIYKNEDIFDLIKYDILTILIKKNPEIFKENNLENFIDLSNLIYIWGKDNIGEIIKTLLEHIPRLGKPLKEVIPLVEKFGQFTKKFEGGEKFLIDDYIKSIKDTSLEETDQISALIRDKVMEQKGVEKKSVLIIDDLDRVDPEHIFRLLNIFSTYFDKEKSNKFGFDHIILVGDERNIKNIFYHKYGIGTDFQGYFDKFFSVYIYDFDNKNEVLNNIEGLLYEFKNTNEPLKPALSRQGYIHLFLLEIFRRAITINDNSKVNLRTIYKGIKYELPSTKSYSGSQSVIRSNEGSELLDTSIKILIQCFGGNPENLNNVLLQCRESAKEGKEFDIDRFPNNIFSIAMLYKMYGRNELDTKVNEVIDFGEHSIKIINPEDLRKPFTVENEGLLFYDLLINYIKKELYNQKLRY